MKKRVYTALAVSIMLGSAIGLFFVMTSLFDLVGTDLSLQSNSDPKMAVSY